MPQPRPRFRTDGKRIFSYRTRADSTYRNNLQTLLKLAYSGGPIDAPVGIEVIFYLPKPKKPRFETPAVKPDIDNYLKALFDAMNGIIFVDDARIVRVIAEKAYGRPSIDLKLFL